MYALVGGAFDTAGPRVGLWCWHLDLDSSFAFSHSGARLLIWELMCNRALIRVFALVGGCWEYPFLAGLWLCSLGAPSPDSSNNVGARLIILGFDVF